MTTIHIHKDKNIGKILLVVEGERTEFYLLHKIFTQVFDYQYEKLDRMNRYQKYNDKDGIPSSIFVVNSEQSALSTVSNSNDYLDTLFERLIEEYKFPVDRAAIYYLFDRDVKSNTDARHIANLIRLLANARDNGMERQGLLLLSYPCIESFTASAFIDDVFDQEFELGKQLKQYLDMCKHNQSRLDEASLIHAVAEMSRAFAQLGIASYDLDHFSDTNLFIFERQELNYAANHKYRLLSLLCIMLLDLGLIELRKD
ncbi:hypothetical protein DQG13_19440 [Paenibacillus sp. YN15]|nr:hypothetical protein DQG13_19440 [Paenibacillus sp. YN15]